MSEHDTLAEALVAALADLTNVAKAHQANTGSYGYSFANIADLIAETRPVLAEHGLVALTPVHEHGDGLACTVTLLHRSGEQMDFGPLPFPPGKDAQSTGSWITYMRRYALLAALGMGAEDDDGAKAQPRQAQQQRPQRPQAPPLSDTERHEIEAAIGALDDDAKVRLREQWKARRIRKLEELTAADLDTVHALIVEIETEATA